MRNDYCPECGHLLSRKGVDCRFCGNYDNRLVKFKIDMDPELAESIAGSNNVSYIENYVFGSEPEKSEKA